MGQRARPMGPRALWGFHNTWPKIVTCPRMAPETKKRLVCGMQFYNWSRPKVGFRHCLPPKSRENCDWAGGRCSDDAIPADREPAIGRGFQIHYAGPTRSGTHTCVPYNTVRYKSTTQFDSNISSTGRSVTRFMLTVSIGPVSHFPRWWFD